MRFLFLVLISFFCPFLPVQAQYFDHDAAFREAAEQADGYFWHDLLPEYAVYLAAFSGGVLLVKAFHK